MTLELWLTQDVPDRAGVSALHAHYLGRCDNPLTALRRLTAAVDAVPRHPVTLTATDADGREHLTLTVSPGPTPDPADAAALVA